MTCETGTILSQSPALTLTLNPNGLSGTGYSLTFTDALDYLCAIPWASSGMLNQSGQPALNTYDALRICLREGIYLQGNPDDPNQISISAIPANFGEYSVQYEYLHLSNRLHVGQIDSSGRTVRLGGIGMIDLMDTDPAHFSYNSLPYFGNAFITNRDGTTVEVASQGVILHKVHVAQTSVEFVSIDGVSPYNFANNYTPGSDEAWVMVMGLVYATS